MSAATFGGIVLIMGSVLMSAFLVHGAREILARSRRLKRGESGL